MANLAQEEADRLFSHRDRFSSHPEDRDESDSESPDEKDVSEPAFAFNPNEDTDDDDLDMSQRMSSLTTTRSNYVVPTTEQYANTGPKGVIADAQSFARARRSASRRTFGPVSGNITYPAQNAQTNDTLKEKAPLSGSEGEQDEDEDGDEDDKFMAEWRATRLAELSSRSESQRTLDAQQSQQRRVSPSRRVYGSVVPVDAMGYLDAIEKVPRETTVVVMLFDPSSRQSLEVEDELDTLAYRYGHVRFVKMDHDEAEMEHVQIPALLAYRGGDLVTTISSAKRDGLERVLHQQGILR